MEKQPTEIHSEENRLPLMLYFSLSLPFVTAGVTAQDSGGTTGAGGPTQEDANIDYD
ncbi:MAG: hypothetical protein HYW71_01920 [Candidatus Niyogibacteria bacterium]|nr:hypothetical protein [Candidatus Niyogibacteria bacterium]